MDYKEWDEITYPVTNFNGATCEVWEWLSNFIPHFNVHVITHPCMLLLIYAGIYINPSCADLRSSPKIKNKGKFCTHNPYVGF